MKALLSEQIMDSECASGRHDGNNFRDYIDKFAEGTVPHAFHASIGCLTSAPSILSAMPERIVPTKYMTVPGLGRDLDPWGQET